MTILLRLCDREGYMKFIFMDVINAYFSFIFLRGASRCLKGAARGISLGIARLQAAEWAEK
jgi:hypothetical protein